MATLPQDQPHVPEKLWLHVRTQGQGVLLDFHCLLVFGPQGPEHCRGGRREGVGLGHRPGLVGRWNLPRVHQLHMARSQRLLQAPHRRLDRFDDPRSQRSVAALGGKLLLLIAIHSPASEPPRYLRTLQRFVSIDNVLSIQECYPQVVQNYTGQCHEANRDSRKAALTCRNWGHRSSGTRTHGIHVFVKAVLELCSATSYLESKAAHKEKCPIQGIEVATLIITPSCPVTRLEISIHLANPPVMNL